MGAPYSGYGDTGLSVSVCMHMCFANMSQYMRILAFVLDFVNVQSTHQSRDSHYPASA